MDIEIRLDDDKNTIKSTDLVDLINEFRKIEGHNKILQHSDFMKKIRKELNTLVSLGLEGEQNFNKSIFLDKQNKERPCYELTIEGLKYIIDITKNSDRIPMQKIYEKMGGNYSKTICIDRFETTFFNKLSDTLKVFNIKLETQKPILNYRLDGYIPKYNLVIEYDESQHFVEPQKSLDIQRQLEIENKLNYKFLRLNYKDTDAYNIGLVLKELMNWMVA